MLLATCNCADPRFPKPEGTYYCKADDVGQRVCLENATDAVPSQLSRLIRLKVGLLEVGGFHGMTDCICPQSCHQEVYGVSYSAAVWPSDDYKVTSVHPIPASLFGNPF